MMMATMGLQHIALHQAKQELYSYNKGNYNNSYNKGKILRQQWCC